MENSIKCLSQGHSDALPHRESNQGFATFRLLTRSSTELRRCQLVVDFKYRAGVGTFSNYLTQNNITFQLSPIQIYLFRHKSSRPRRSAKAFSFRYTGLPAIALSINLEMDTFRQLYLQCYPLHEI